MTQDDPETAVAAVVRRAEAALGGFTRHMRREIALCSPVKYQWVGKHMRTFVIAFGLASILAGCSHGVPVGTVPSCTSPPSSTAGGPQTETVRCGVGWGFSLDVPERMQMEHVARFDFDVYTLLDDGELILAWYLGGWPQFPEDAPWAMVGSARGRCTTVRPEMNCLFEVKGQEHAPLLHMWHGPLTPEELKHVEAILATLKLD
jgi:hypothetical protein